MKKARSNQFCELFSSVADSANNSHNPTYIFGDTNIDCLKYGNCTNSTNYVDMLFSHGMLQVVSKPTRCTDSSATLLTMLSLILFRINMTLLFSSLNCPIISLCSIFLNVQSSFPPQNRLRVGTSRTQIWRSSGPRSRHWAGMMSPLSVIHS